MTIEAKPGTFFASLREADRESLRQAGQEFPVADREILFTEGSAPEHVHIVLSGNLMLTKCTGDDEYIVVELRSAGSILGELSALDDSSRSTSAVAVQTSTVLAIETDVFLGLVRSNPAIAGSLQQAMANKMRQSTARQLETSTVDSLGRVCGRLVELCRLSGVPTGKSWEVPSLLSQKELAAWVGVSRDAVVGSLRMARRLGWLETGRLRFVITDLQAIENRAMAV